MKQKKERPETERINLLIFARIMEKLVRDNPKLTVARVGQVRVSRWVEWRDWLPTIMPKAKMTKVVLGSRDKKKEKKRVYVLETEKWLKILKGRWKMTKNPIELIKTEEIREEEKKKVLATARFVGEE